MRHAMPAIILLLAAAPPACGGPPEAPRDAGRIRLVLTNGDQVSGTWVPGAIGIVNGMGCLKIPLKEILSVRFGSVPAEERDSVECRDGLLQGFVQLQEGVSLETPYGTLRIPRQDLVSLTPEADRPNTLRVKAYIDGISQLCLKGDRVWWRHLRHAAPGRHLGENLPTCLDGATWFPEWPDPGGELRQGATSCARVLDPARFPLTAKGLKIDRIEARGGVRVVDAEEEGTIAVEFDDDLASGAAWYEVVLSW